MSEYPWYLSTVGGMFADDPHIEMVFVLAWHGTHATVIESNGEYPREGATPYLVPVSHLRLGLPPEAVAA